MSDNIFASYFFMSYLRKGSSFEWPGRCRYSTLFGAEKSKRKRKKKKKYKREKRKKKEEKSKKEREPKRDKACGYVYECGKLTDSKQGERVHPFLRWRNKESQKIKRKNE